MATLTHPRLVFIIVFLVIKSIPGMISESLYQNRDVSHLVGSVACPWEAAAWTDWGNLWTTRPVARCKCYVPCNWTGWGLKGKLGSAGEVLSGGESRGALGRWGSMILRRHRSYSSATRAAQGGRLRTLLCEQMWKERVWCQPTFDLHLWRSKIHLVLQRPDKVLLFSQEGSGLTV